MDNKIKHTTLAETIKTISKLSNVSQNDVKNVLEQYHLFILGDLIEKGETKINSLGKIKLVLKPSRIAIDFTTQEKILMPAKIQPKFIFSRAIKDLVADKVSVKKFESTQK